MKTKLYLVCFALIFTLALSAVPIQVLHQDATFMSYSYTHGILDNFYYEYWVDGGNAIIEHDGTGDDVPISNANGFGNVIYFAPPGDLWLPLAVTFLDAGTGPGLPEAEQGSLVYVKMYDAPDPISALNYCVSQYPGDFYTVPPSGPNTLEAGIDYFWSVWFPIGGAGDIDWGGGMTGSVDVGTPSAPGSGYGTGLPNEDDLVNPANVGLYFTLTIDDGAPVAVTICLDLTTLGYSPWNLAYFVNGAWVYYPDPYTPMTWTSDCVTFTLDPTPARADVDVPIVFSNLDGPLPVTLTNFAAEFVSNNLTILWTTQSESNNMGWNIYRGESNTALEEDNTILINGIELIEGAGTTSEPTDYTFQDQYPIVENNTYWYWLESVSYSNDTGIYGPISLTIPEGAIIPELPTTTTLYGNYPNPFNPITTIQFDIKEGETADLTIYNIKGQIVESGIYQAGAHNYEWDSKDNASGVYFYKLSSDSYSEFKKMMLLK